MVFTAPTVSDFRQKGGTLSEKLIFIFSSIASVLGKAEVKTVDLTASMVSSTSLEANGADVAAGANATYYAVWTVPEACTIKDVVTAITEVYKKDTTDAKIEITDNAASPVTKFTYTFPTAGRAAKDVVIHSTIASASLAAGDILNLKITATASSTGTGHAKVFLRYTVD